ALDVEIVGHVDGALAELPSGVGVEGAGELRARGRQVVDLLEGRLAAGRESAGDDERRDSLGRHVLAPAWVRPGRQPPPLEIERGGALFNGIFRNSRRRCCPRVTPSLLSIHVASGAPGSLGPRGWTELSWLSLRRVARRRRRGGVQHRAQRLSRGALR